MKTKKEILIELIGKEVYILQGDNGSLHMDLLDGGYSQKIVIKEVGEDLILVDNLREKRTQYISTDIIHYITLEKLT